MNWTFLLGLFDTQNTLRMEHPVVSTVHCWHCSQHYKVTNKIQSLTIENMCILRRSPKNNKKRQGEKLFAHYHDKKAPLSNTAPRETVICKQTCLLIHVKVSLGNLILQVYKGMTHQHKNTKLRSWCLRQKQFQIVARQGSLLEDAAAFVLWSSWWFSILLASKTSCCSRFILGCSKDSQMEQIA